MINNKDEMFIKANSHVNIVSIQRDGEYYTIELNYPDNEDREVKNVRVCSSTSWK